MKIKLINTALILFAVVAPVFSSDITISTAALKVINSEGDESACTVSSDRKMIIFARKLKGAAGSDLYYTEYISGKWSEAKPVEPLNSESDELTPYLTKDGKTIYFASNRGGSLKSGAASGPSFDIYYSEKKDGKWENPAQVFGAINTMSDELSPSVTADGKTIFFTRTSPGGTGKPKIIKVTKKGEFWEDVETAKIPGDISYIASAATRSAYRSAYIFSGYRDGGQSRDIFFMNPSGSNGDSITKDPGMNTDGDEISFCELDSKTLIVSTNSGGIAGSYDLFIKKISATTAAAIARSDISIKTSVKGYDNPEGVNVRLLYFKTSKPGIEPFRSETKQPDSNGEINIKVTSDIRRILAIPGNRDMKEFAIEILPGRSFVTPSLIFEKKQDKEFRIKAVYFAFNSSELQVADIPYMHDLIEYLRKNGQIKISIEGYADGTGSYRANMSISLARAESVKSYLVKHGIDKNRLKTSGKGYIKENPKDTSQFNRRVEFIPGE